MKNTRVIKELKRIAAGHGGVLLPRVVVDEARPKKSPLHSRFEWDDSKAAEAHRLWQARQLISVCVEVVPGFDEPVDVFVSLSSDRGDGGYRTTAHVMSDAELREQLFNDALMELNGFQHKYQSLRRLAGVFDAIKKVRKAA